MQNKPKILIIDNKIDITYYTSIEHFDDNKIILKLNDKYVNITGSNLIISKLIIDEILISGNIDKIEFR